ncbi:hypothetical protein G7Y89_g2320 [Cudoniella acicularis]|uniref:Uncharacterized protein n=1 Tax=Cudoniella acicularis TaxID=354080 RepID=A0A8H4RUN4_9HELO|nr:hypothetical protein G7Y89_g2320 [Cudoniella acicularis]
MAPERKHRSSGKGRKVTHHHQEGESNRSWTNRGTATSTNNTFIEQRSPVNAHGSTYQNISANDQLHANEQTANTYIERPWGQYFDAPNDNTYMYGALPMEKWQTEGAIDQPWHGMEAVYVPGSQDVGFDNGNNGAADGLNYEGGMDGSTEGVDSMACQAASSEKRDT